ncbi:competence protein ComEA [Thermolongibacillus altinsuensis]|uniref:Competence protein ComEA n=1 Tax=Thermolongibacillus altinsuensis TaxID=575256 RepID=A0A4R1QFC0_9BACL|nr:helix-hairpin-helix domain-containing protein [Thermolongibacillus altinsuensis]TCL48883.1 competence protein ComEA [Thermolongibacillus altinsuensis]GMB07560.1 competence protein ComE [Thermolongibacillus altinsuensis]
MKWIKKYERWLYIGGMVLTAFIFFWINKDSEKEMISPPIENETAESVEAEAKPLTVFVDVKGAVVHEGVYEVDESSRIKDVIQLAGGFTEEADRTKVNLAAKVQDEMMVYVPKKGEETPTVMSEQTTAAGNEKKVNINTATAEELQTLSGIGPAKADAIIAYREENGPFQKIEDLLNVSGIGEKSLEKIKEQIIVK